MVRYNPPPGWKELGGKRIFFRSRWEYRFGQYLQFLKDQRSILEWHHEPHTFWFQGIKRGVCSYLPDFLVIEPTGKEWYAEVKGFMDKRSATKIKRFAKYYPDEELRLIDSKWFKLNGKKIKPLVKDW